MGPFEDPSTPRENQDTRGPFKTQRCKRRAHRPRSRVCLLKGCEGVFRPQHPLTRYCSEACRERARRWREWKARRRYRQSAGCKQKRRAQSRRYRERRKSTNRKTQLAGNTRVIPINFFSVLLRPPRMLRPFPAYPAITVAAFLFSGLSPCSGASSGAGETLARTAPQPGGERNSQEKCPAPPAMKTCRYRPDILQLALQSR
jgi:hypothetical protein